MKLDITIQEAESLYLELSSKDFSLDLTRGKPHRDQLSLSDELENSLFGDYFYEGIDTRNYGELLGLEACRQLGANLLSCRKEMVIAGGNSSLTLMSQYLSSLYFHGAGDGPFSQSVRTSFLCPVPGYDRHFSLCEEFCINMIPVPLTGQGPDIDFIKLLVANDSSIKGIWCVPKHSNPTGETYSEDTVSGLLEIAKIANKDFRKHGILKNEDSKMRYNDGKVGPNGDFYIGSMHKEFDPESGNLYKVTSKGQVSVAIPNTTISNGMAWTADKKTFYFSDTENYRIDRYDFDIDSGNLKNRKTAFNIPKELGGADGMCIDSEDMLWIAHWGGACIRQWNPRTGEIIQKIEVAAPHVTSCCFGGKNLDTLYITTARSGLSEEQLEKYPQSGGLFTFKPGVTGALITYFKEL